MLDAFKSVWYMFKVGFEEALYYVWDDMPVMSRNAQKIFAHKEDRKKYIDAVQCLKDGTIEEITIELHTGEKITLCH